MKIQIGYKQTEVLINKGDYKKLFKKGKYFYITEHGYVGCKFYVDGKQKNDYLHRMIMNAPKGLEVDHINRHRLDNRKSNLRLCKGGSNAFNKEGRKGYKGIYFHKINKKWIAQITKKQETKSLGSFKTPEEAALKYNQFAKLLHGKYAYLNKVS